jgi:hypothetical protein
VSTAKPPRLFVSGLTGRIYIATQWREMPNGSVVANEKFDVTAEFEAIAEERVDATIERIKAMCDEAKSEGASAVTLDIILATLADTAVSS